MYVSNRVGTTVGSIGPVSGSSPGRAAESGATTTSGAGDGATRSVSGPAQLMSKLSQLRDSNPAQLSQVVTSLASGLRDVAAQDTGMGAKMLTALASKLDDIARGGDISQLGPAAAPERPAGSPAGGSNATATYRGNAEAPGAGGEAHRAALSQMLDELDAALKATGSRPA